MNVGTSIYKKKDSHLVYVDGKIYAGMHYLVDMWGICNEESTNKINDLLWINRRGPCGPISSAQILFKTRDLVRTLISKENSERKLKEP